MRSADAADPIIRAALRVFGEHGIDATSLREIARVAEVSPALIVHHFGSKQGLIAAVDEAALLEFGAAYCCASGPRRPPARCASGLMSAPLSAGRWSRPLPEAPAFSK